MEIVYAFGIALLAAGYLPLGASRAKKLATAMIITGILLLPGINVFSQMLAHPINAVTENGYVDALFFSYVIGISLFLSGIAIYPGSIGKAITSRMKPLFSFLVSNPWYGVAGIVATLILYYAGSLMYADFEAWLMNYASAVAQGAM